MSCAPNAAPWTAGSDAIARNGCSAGSGANRSVVDFGSSDRTRPTSRRSQKPLGGRVIALAKIGSSSRAASPSRSITPPTEPPAAPNARPELAFLQRAIAGRRPGAARAAGARNDISDVAVLRFTCAVTSSSLNTRAAGRSSIGGSSAGAADSVRPPASNAADAGSWPSSMTRKPRRASSAPATSPLVSPPQTMTS